MTIRTAFTVLIALSLVACGKNKAESKLQGLENLNGPQFGVMKMGVDAFNSIIGKDVVDPNHDGYPITVVVKTQDELNAIAPKASEFNPRFGMALQEYSGCSIQLSESIFLPGSEDLAKTVIAHELAHCMGILHDAGDAEIMSPTVHALNSYTAEAIHRFSTHVKQVLWLEKPASETK